LPTSRKVYVVGQQGLKAEIEAFGYTVLGGPAHAHARLDKIPDTFEIDLSVGAVVVGFDRDINYYKMTYATMCAREIDDCHFIATNRDAITHLNNDQEFPGGGTMVAALATSIGREPEVAGKPSPLLVHAVRHSTGLDDSAAACMVGDRLDTDIVFGNTTGMTTLLVLSGVTRLEQVSDALPTESQPTLVASSLASLAAVMCG
jgi:phosphoglycolate/pyridoxal phosphate phosphatase family enzyme